MALAISRFCASMSFCDRKLRIDSGDFTILMGIVCLSFYRMITCSVGKNTFFSSGGLLRPDPEIKKAVPYRRTANGSHFRHFWLNSISQIGLWKHSRGWAAPRAPNHRQGTIILCLFWPHRKAKKNIFGVRKRIYLQCPAANAIMPAILE